MIIFILDCGKAKKYQEHSQRVVRLGDLEDCCYDFYLVPANFLSHSLVQKKLLSVYYEPAIDEQNNKIL
jgi:hypothetical protein